MKSRKWTDIPGWDSPSPENEARRDIFLEDRFSYGGFENGVRYYENASGEKDLPLVVFLHGADACGSDNESPIASHDVGTIFADESWQSEHPCHIVVPQYKKGKHWALPVMTEYIYELTMSYAGRFAADMSRMYVYGYSAGAIGIFALLKKYPIYAAAVPICGATEDSEMDMLLQTPLWLYHADDDPMVSPDTFEVIYYKAPHIGSNAIYDRLVQMGHRELHYTRIPAGQMEDEYHLHPHCTWVLMGEDQECREWMFAQRRRRS